MLQLFDDCNVLGTFFVLGWVAERYPKLVQRIVAAGHELASHGYWHQLVYDLTPDEFRTDVRTSRDILQQTGGVPVTAYRAPSFSIVQRSMWALDILVEEGYTVDSSIFPIKHDRYGVPDALPQIHERQTTAGPITEVPPSFWTSRSGNVPIGGGYFRLFPLTVTQHAIARVQSQGRPAMFYIHPWEIDPDQPRIKNAGVKSRLRHYVGLRKTEQKLRKLLTNTPFGTLGQALYP